MFDAWDDKKQEGQIGYVADFCPVCRGLRPFRLFPIKRAGYVCGFPVGKSRVIAYYRVCNDCGVRLEADPAMFTGTVPILPENMDRLIAETHPDIYVTYRHRLMLEERVKSKPLGLEHTERTTLIREPFDIIAKAYEARYSSEAGNHLGMGDAIYILLGGSTARYRPESEIDLHGMLALLATCGVPIAVMMLARVAPTSSELEFLVHDNTAFSCWMLAGLGTTMFFLKTAKSRYIKARLMPLLCRALKPLQPNAVEIDSVLRDLETKDFTLGKKLSARSVVEALAPHTIPSSPSVPGMLDHDSPASRRF